MSRCRHDDSRAADEAVGRSGVRTDPPGACPSCGTSRDEAKAAGPRAGSHLLACVPGLERLVAAEVTELDPDASVEGVPAPGLVLARGLETDPLVLRTVQHVVRVRAEATAGDLDGLRSAVGAVDVPELAGARSFRATGVVHGAAPFSAREAAGAAGFAVKRRHGTAVYLEAPDVNVRVDVVGDRLFVGVQLTREPLDRRVRRGAPLRVSLKATVAAALVRAAGAHRGGGAILDPTCGSGTIVVEAAAACPALELHASDWDAATLEVARGTFRNHGLEVATRCVDARRLESGWGRTFRFVVANPPFGRRVGRRLRIAAFLEEVLRSAASVLERGGRLALVTPRRKALERALLRVPLRVLDEHSAAMGDLRPGLFVLAPE